MGEGKKKLEIGNLVRKEEPILPPPPIPSQVRMSMVTSPPVPVENRKVPPLPLDEERTMTKEEKEKEWPTEEACGTITIQVFQHRPYLVEFTGVVTGGQIDLAWRAMMKKYRVWKHTLIKSDIQLGGE